MGYKLIWKGEVIDEADDLKTAQYLQGEYNLAHKGGVTIKEANNRQDVKDLLLRGGFDENDDIDSLLDDFGL